MSDLLAPWAVTAPGQVPFSCDSKAAAVVILKTSTTRDVNTRTMLSPGPVLGITLAEAMRIRRIEKRAAQILPIDIPFVRQRPGGVGPGQLYSAAHSEVESKLKVDRHREEAVAVQRIGLQSREWPW